ncbi:N-Dimethylarginine dimethylaminohydrolase [Dethiosulfatibacter aminovorans DSM 17477]|uniref:N-Dimethylarginine dimethylaminohydrolase n=1 Tax=Dethiosulfatibacter aminovorans DSM 17477 TaxID=1121476 RepID=A0A1M6BRC6_9FIRM|nr:arginine deiminase family protein [Dethiosulfatibacter aminovorans]SHI51078.1 N-Dimethylarginine dimethylaminohydrolase [Dethiosulfatibacter aminovorans DSM 17477]
MKYGCQSMHKKIDRILIKHPKDAFISQENLSKTWEAFNYTSEPDYETVLKEYEVFENIIKENVANVDYLPQSDNVGLDSIYTHDSLKITEKGAIFFNTGKLLRQKEGFEVEKKFKEVGIDTLGWIQSPGKIEGGDVVWIDEKTVAIGRGYRTNDEGIRQFKELTKDIVDEYIIVPMPHADGEAECLHLMSIISIVDEDLAVVYSRYMPVPFREYLIERGFELVEVNDEEYDNLGSNVLALAPRVCVLMEGNRDIYDKLHEKGCKLYTYPGAELSFKGTGGPTCLTCPVARV